MGRRLHNGALRRRAAFAAIAALIAVNPEAAAAEDFFSFLFGGGPPQRQRSQPREPASASDFFSDPFGLNPPPAAPPRPVASAGSGPAFCVRSCDGRYFPLTARGAASPVQMCQAFCPASATKVFFGASIETASSANGDRYADSDTAFAYRKALKADCTCNGRNPAGLAPVDLTLDASLRPGDVVATATGLVAYSGAHGASPATDFSPVASYAGLTSEVRARLGEMKVAPVSAEIGDQAKPVPADPAPAAARKPAARMKRAAVN